MFVTRKKAREYLNKNWRFAILIEILYVIAEILLIAAGFRLQLFFLLLIGDLLLISPLKAGRALYYRTLVTTPNNAKVHLLFRFCKNKYIHTVWWRLGMWLRRISVFCPLCLFSSFFLYVSRLAEQKEQPTIAIISFALSLVFLLFAYLITEIILFRYLPSIYFLPENSVKDAIKTSRHLTKGKTPTWIFFHLDYAPLSFLLILIVPFFYLSPLLQTARAATVRELFSSISPCIHEQHLKRRKNHGRIRNEF